MLQSFAEFIAITNTETHAMIASVIFLQHPHDYCVQPLYQQELKV